MTMHTKGPWAFDLGVIYADGGIQPHIAYLPSKPNCADPQELANANLLAAAPDLLAALKLITDAFIYVHGDGWETTKIARAAIARAEGGVS